MRILIRGTNWIGDAVMTIPAIKRLRRLFPDSKIALLTPESTVGIFSESGLVDEVIAAGSLHQQATEMRRRRFDVAIVFPNSFSTALAARLSGAKRRFGYAANRRALLLTDAVEVPGWKNERHEVYYYLNLIDAVERSIVDKASRSDEPDIGITVSDTVRARASEILAREGTDPDKRTVGLAAGSTNSRAKRWTPESFARLNDRLHSELDANVVLLGSIGDREVSSRVAELSQIRPIDLTGRTDVETAAAILGQLDLLVSNDMGLAHLAPAVGTRTIVIFGPTNPVTTRPFSELATVVSAGVECSPCMLRECPIDHRCMTRITADDIFERARSILTDDN